MNYYAIKFEREAKARPTDWMIVPSGRGYRLVFVGGGE